MVTMLQNGETVMPKLTILHRAEFPGDYASVLALIEVEAGEYVARHTHPGLEMTYLLDCEATLSVDGRADQPMKAGDWFEVPAETPHSVQIGDKPGRALGHYVVEKAKPITAWLEEPATFEIKG
jgi:quercetin dioxygenase-like cupin family protein